MATGLARSRWHLVASGARSRRACRRRRPNGGLQASKPEMAWLGMGVPPYLYIQVAPCRAELGRDAHTGIPTTNMGETPMPLQTHGRDARATSNRRAGGRCLIQFGARAMSGVAWACRQTFTPTSPSVRDRKRRPPASPPRDRGNFRDRRPSQYRDSRPRRLS